MLLIGAIASCAYEKKSDAPVSPLNGTWKLVSAQSIAQGDTMVTFPVEGQHMIKIFNSTHFSFFNHDVKKGQDTTQAMFVAGAGRYTLDGETYHENLEYCSARGWEGHDFDFTLTFRQDTLIQRGVEEIDSLGVGREILETYVRMSTTQ